MIRARKEKGQEEQMKALERAKALLTEEGYTCVLVKGEKTVTDRRRGVQPLLSLLDSGEDYHGFSAADKVVGKAAAFLYVLLGIGELHAGVLSRHAAAVLEESGISFSYDTLVGAIRNRTDTGYCPMETAVLEIREPSAAPEAIRKKLREMQG